MANIQERRNKEGKLISFSIRVHRGRDSEGRQLKPFTQTFKVKPTWTEKSARKKAEAFAATFEKECKEGLRSDNRQKFADYCDYCIDMKVRRGLKHSTATRYRELTSRIYPSIGHIKMPDIRVDHLNKLYSDLSKDGVSKRGGKLSPKTVLEHHRLIHTVLDTAVKEGLIPFNPADRVTLPKIQKKEIECFQPEEVVAIRKALESEPIKWRTITHLLLITGARRGEILGLKWSKVDFENSRIYIDNNVLYTPERGVYEDAPKTKQSVRYISIPLETTKLLKEYKIWQSEEMLRLGAYYDRRDFVFSQDNGSPMHPDSVTDWLRKFSKRHNLPHINPHKFRHTMASMLYYNGMDSVSISKRLGHAQVSTTANIYAHQIEEADKKNAEILSDIFLKKA